MNKIYHSIKLLLYKIKNKQNTLGVFELDRKCSGILKDTAMLMVPGKHCKPEHHHNLIPLQTRTPTQFNTFKLQNGQTPI